MKLVDHYIITVDNVWDERVDGGIITMNAVRYIDQDRDRFERKRLVGTIVAMPLGFSGKPHQYLDPGFPNHRLNVGHDDIQQAISEGNTNYLDWELYYNVAGKDSLDFLTLADYPCDAQVGETVIFHPGVTEPDNLLEPNTYKCRPDQLICVSRETLVMQGGYVLVEPIAVVNEEAGFILSIEAENELLRGIVRHSVDLAPGTEIGFVENADWTIEIDGVKYFAMRNDEIMLSSQSDTQTKEIK